MGDRANINASYGGRQSGLDGEAIMASMGGAPVTAAPVTSSVFGNGTWDDTASWNDNDTWKDAA